MSRQLQDTSFSVHRRDRTTLSAGRFSTRLGIYIVGWLCDGHWLIRGALYRSWVPPLEDLLLPFMLSLVF